VRFQLARAERVVEWKKEEAKIGKDRYPVYESIRTIVADIDKERAIKLTDDLTNDLRDRKLIFRGWKSQRDVRHKVRTEIRIQLIARLRNYRSNIDGLTDGIFEALEVTE
jgi:hypothetical protein